MVLARAGGQTPGELRAATARAVITADPDAAEKRRQAAITSRSVSQYVRPDGTGVLGSHVSAADSVAMYDLINETAQRLTGPDDTRTADARRADAHVWLLLGRDPHLGPTGDTNDDDDPPPPPAGPPDPYDDTPDPDVTPDPGVAPDPDVTPDPDVAPEPGVTPDPGVAPEPGAEQAPATASDADAGAVDSDDMVDPDPRAGADDAVDGRSTDANAEASESPPAGAPYEVDGRFPPEPDDLDERFPPERDLVGELIARCLAVAQDRRPGRIPWVQLHHGTPMSPAPGVTRVTPDGPFAYLEGYGPITIHAGRDLLDTGHAQRPPDIPTTLFHATWGGVLRHDPPATMDRQVRARDGTCRFPTCRARARRADLDHTRRFPDGLTLPGNLAGLCRRHHRIKHRAGWTVQQAAHGILHWTSPTGQTYTTYPRGLDHTGPGTANGHLNINGNPVTINGNPVTEADRSTGNPQAAEGRATGAPAHRSVGVPWPALPSKLALAAKRTGAAA